MSMTTTTEEELSAILDAVRDFAASEMAPYAAEWDEHGTFPRDTLQRAGELGLGGIYVADDGGGAALGRSDAAAIFESLAYADPTITAYMTIHTWSAG